MQEDPFNPVFSVSHRKSVFDPIFWQSVPTPANLMFPDAGVEGAMSEGSRSYGAAYQRYPNRLALFVAENTAVLHTVCTASVPNRLTPLPIKQP